MNVSPARWGSHPKPNVSAALQRRAEHQLDASQRQCQRSVIQRKRADCKQGVAARTGRRNQQRSNELERRLDAAACSQMQASPLACSARRERVAIAHPTCDCPVLRWASIAVRAFSTCLHVQTAPPSSTEKQHQWHEIVYTQVPP